MVPVKAAVDAGDWKKAIAETVKHFTSAWTCGMRGKDVMQVKVDPKAESRSQTWYSSQVRNADTDSHLLAKRSWWASEIPARTAEQGFRPAAIHWHFDRVLAGAYTQPAGRSTLGRRSSCGCSSYSITQPETGLQDEEFLGTSSCGTTAPRGAHSGPRRPGLRRLYNYSGWTNDETMVFLSFIEDNAAGSTRRPAAPTGRGSREGLCGLGVRFPE